MPTLKITGTNVRKAAEQYINNGFHVFAVKLGDKQPATAHGFKDAICSLDLIPKMFPSLDYNIGIATGDVSGVFVIDVDMRPAKEGKKEVNGAIELARLERELCPLPQTMTAATGSGLHYYFKKPPGVKLVSKICEGLDIRSDGGYVVAPPSFHQSGKVYSFVNELEPIEITKEWLERIIALDVPAQIPAASAPVAPKTPALESVEDAAAQYNNSNTRDWPLSPSAVFISPCCGHRGCFHRHPENTTKWVCFSTNHPDGLGAKLSNCYIGEQLDIDAYHNGRTRVEQLIVSGYYKRREFTPLPDPSDAPHDIDDGSLPVPESAEHIIETPRWEKPTIHITTNVTEVVNETVAALVKNQSLWMFQRGGELVRIVFDFSRRTRATDDEGSRMFRPRRQPKIKIVDIHYLREACDRSAKFVSITERTNKRTGEVTTLVDEKIAPDWLLNNILARGSWPFREIEGVVETPTIRPDGSILERQGHDLDTGLVLYPTRGVGFENINPKMNREEATSALMDLEDLFVDFPFQDPCDKAAAVAAVVSVVCRSCIVGPVPMFVIRATKPGSGKTLLANVIETIRSGRDGCAMMSPTKDVEEERKQALSLAMEAAPVVLIDNVRGKFGSEVLDGILTSGKIKGRMLGTNSIPEFKFNAVWLVTGNNITFRGDIDRRMLLIDLDPKNEEGRTEFRHGNGAQFFTYLRQKRKSIVPKILAAMKAYIDAGHPRDPMDMRLLPSFEDWDRHVVGLLTWCGLPNPLGTRDRFENSGDTEADLLFEILETLLIEYPIDGTLFTWTDVYNLYTKSERMKLAVSALMPARTPAVGHALAEIPYALRSYMRRSVRGIALTARHTRQGNRLMLIVDRSRYKPTAEDLGGVFPEIVDAAKNDAKGFTF